MPKYSQGEQSRCSISYEPTTKVHCDILASTPDRSVFDQGVEGFEMLRTWILEFGVIHVIISPVRTTAGSNMQGREEEFSGSKFKHSLLTWKRMKT